MAGSLSDLSDTLVYPNQAVLGESVDGVAVFARALDVDGVRENGLPAGVRRNDDLDDGLVALDHGPYDLLGLRDEQVAEGKYRNSTTATPGAVLFSSRPAGDAFWAPTPVRDMVDAVVLQLGLSGLARVGEDAAGSTLFTTNRIFTKYFFLMYPCRLVVLAEELVAVVHLVLLPHADVVLAIHEDLFR